MDFLTTIGGQPVYYVANRGSNRRSGPSWGRVLYPGTGAGVVFGQTLNQRKAGTYFTSGRFDGCIWKEVFSSPARQFADLLIDPGADGHDVPGDAQNEAE